MKNVYKVSFVVDYRSGKKRQTYDGGVESLNVLVSGSAEAAIRLAKKHAMRATCDPNGGEAITPVRFTLLAVSEIVDDVIV